MLIPLVGSGREGFYHPMAIQETAEFLWPVQRLIASQPSGGRALPLTEDLILELWEHSATWWLPLPRPLKTMTGLCCLCIGLLAFVGD